MKRWFERLRAHGWVRAISRWSGESSWVGLLPKMLAGTAALLLLGLVGSGAVDHLFLSRQASALDAAAGLRGPNMHLPPGAGAESSAAPSAPSAPPLADRGSVAASASASAGGDAKPPVVLNTATAAELDKLPGIGPGKAQKIVELREKLGGRFHRLEDLYRIKGIKRRLLDRIRPLVVLDPPADGAPVPAPTPPVPSPGPPHAGR